MKLGLAEEIQVSNGLKKAVSLAPQFVYVCCSG